MSEVLRCNNLGKRFAQGEQTLEVLREVNFSLAVGARTAIVGSSGSGKSTLLALLGGLDTPSTGQVLLQGQDLAQLGEAQRGRLRNQALGFVYQFHHLLPEFTALENVAMPLLVRGIAPKQASAQAAELLERVGLGQRLQHKPAKLSGGERQRAAVARALITRPACVLADEPTGNLDRASAERVFELLLELNQELGTSILLVTHDLALAQRMDSCWRMLDGQLQLATDTP